VITGNAGVTGEEWRAARDEALDDGAGGLVDDVDREPGLQRPVGDGGQGDRLVTHRRFALNRSSIARSFGAAAVSEKLCVPPG
jgi:hypothetical protein